MLLHNKLIINTLTDNKPLILSCCLHYAAGAFAIYCAIKINN